MRFPAYFWGEILKNLLQFLFQSGMLYPTKAKLGYIFSLERQLRLRMRLCFYLAIFFIYLLIIYPACPARDEKSDDPPARVVAFSFARRGAEYKPPKHCSTRLRISPSSTKPASWPINSYPTACSIPAIHCCYTNALLRNYRRCCVSTSARLASSTVT